MARLGLLLDDLAVLLGELVELAQRGQRGQVLQREELEELAGGAVEDGPARLLLLAEDLDELPLQQRLHHRAAVDAADLLDLGAGHRLPVGDDGQRLERGAGEPLRLHLEEAAGEGRVVGRGAELPAARHLVEHDAARPLAVVAGELVERLLDPLRLDAGGLPDLLDGERPLGQEEQRLDDGPDAGRRRAAWRRRPASRTAPPSRRPRRSRPARPRRAPDRPWPPRPPAALGQLLRRRPPASRAGRRCSAVIGTPPASRRAPRRRGCPSPRRGSPRRPRRPRRWRPGRCRISFSLAISRMARKVAITSERVSGAPPGAGAAAPRRWRAAGAAAPPPPGRWRR